MANLVRGSKLLQPVSTAPVQNNPVPQNDFWGGVGGFLGNAVNNLVKGTVSTGQKALNTAAAGATGLETLGQAGLDALTGNKDYQTHLDTNANKLADYLNRKTITGDQGAFITLPQAQNKNNDIVGNFVKPILATAGEVAPMVLPYGAISKAAAPIADVVAGKIGTNLVGKTVGKATQYGTEGAIVAPISAATNALGQFGTTGTFDPTQAIKTGLQSGAMVAAGNATTGLVGKGAKAAGQKIADTSIKPAYAYLDPNMNLPKGADNLPIVGQNLGTVDNSTKNYIDQLSKAQADAAKPNGNKLTVAKNEFVAKGIDALSPIEKPVEKAAGGRDQALSLRNQLDRSLRSDTIAGQYAKDNGLHDIVNGVKDTKAFDQYVIAKHAADLEANGVNTGRDLGKDAKLVQDLGSKYEPQAKALNDYNNKLLDKTVGYGLISPETAGYLKQKYPNYVPFDRIFTDKEMAAQKGNGSGPASLSTQTVVQRIKGSDRQIHSPLESVLAKTHDVIAQGERNLAAKEIVNTRMLPGNPLGLRELKPNETIGNRSTISHIDNGQKRVFETTPEAAQAAKSLNKIQLGLVGKILSYPTRALRLGATGVNLPFAATNVIKDAASAFINSRHPLQSSIANPKVFLQALSAAFNHGGKSYAELVREGAGGTSFDIARNNAKQTIAKIRADRNPVTKTLYTVRHPGELLRAVEDTIGRSEEFSRAKEYFGNKQAAIRNGKSVSEAKAYGADAARNNTVNFARAGEYGRVLNSVLPYLNAGIQGSRTLMRNLRDRPLQTGAKIALTASLPIATTTAWNLNDPKRKAAYDDIQEYEKQGNIIIVPSNPVKDPKTGRWNVIKIPVSQEIANLNNIVRNGVEAMQKDKNFDFGAMVGDLTGTVTSLNAQNPRQLLGQVTPQGIKPGIEALTNQNLFTGNPIVPDKMKNLDAKDQYGQNTSGTAKVFGGATNISPYIIDNTIKTALGGAGQSLVNVTDNALAGAGVINPADIGGKSLGESISNRFTSAQGQTAYAPIDKAIQDNISKLKATDGYKQLNPDEKAKAIARLQNDVVIATKQQIDAAKGTGQYANGYKGAQTKLSSRQAGLLNGTTDVSSYLTTQAPKGTSNPATKYQAAQAKYMADKASGKLSSVQDYQAQQSLRKASITSKYSSDAQRFYGMSKAQQNAYFTQDRAGATKLYDQAKAMDAELVASGVIAKSKFSTGSAVSGKSRGTRKKVSTKSNYNYAKGLTSVKAPKQNAVRNLIKKTTFKRKAIKV